MSTVTNPLAQAGLVGLGGLAGLFPTPTTTNSTTTGSSTTGTLTDQQIATLLSTLSSIQGTQAQQQSGATTGISTGGYATPGATNLSGQLAGTYSSIAQPTNLAPYESQQIAQINQNANSQNSSQQAELAARGLSTSPVSGAVAAQTQAGRVAQTTSLEESLPVLQQQLTLQNLGAGTSYLAGAPKTQNTGGTTTGTTTGQTSQTGTTSQIGNTSQSGSQNTNVNSTSTTQQNQEAGGGLSGLFGGLGSVLASLFG
jgi:hypothetical protein